MSDATSPNAEQITNWNENAGRTWVELNPLLDRQLEGISRRTIDVLAPRAGERLLDIGCGCGRSTLELAARVGPSGSVVGLDVSGPMLDIARQRAAAASLANVQFIQADAQTHALERHAFDAVFSCFGVMFFADPVEAFRNLRGALRPGGRLGFLCWRSPAENPIMTSPMDAVRHRLPPQPPPVPGAPGPFAFADAGRVRSVLEGAGFADVVLTPHDEDMGGNDLEGAVTLALRLGPLGSTLRQHPHLVAEVRDDVRAAFAPHVRDGIVWQRSATWIVTAR